MKKKIYSKLICLFALTAAAMLTVIPAMEVQAAPQTGTYQKRYARTTNDCCRTVIIKKITKKRVVFQMLYDQNIPPRLAHSERIIGKRKGNTVTFNYKDISWGEKGKGTMKLSKKYVKIKAVKTGTIGSWHQGAWIGTAGKWYKLKRVSDKKKFYSH